MDYLNDQDRQGVTENAPLIQEIPKRLRSSPSRAPTLTASAPSIADVDIPKGRTHHVVINLLAAIVFVASSSGGFSQIPLTRLIEDAFCRQYYNDQELHGPINEEFCKIDIIQSNVAFVLAIGSAIEAAVGFLAALPWGLVSDRIGRKPVFALALLGGTLSSFWWMVVLWFQPVLPIWLGWLASVMLLIGGGSSVLFAIIATMVADIAPEDERAIIFMRIHIASMAGNFASPTLSSALMDVGGPWPVMWAGIACLLIAAVAIMFIPETLHHKRQFKTQHLISLKDHLSQTFSQLKDSLSILKAPLILLFTASFLTQPIFPATFQLLIQYISKRYNVRIKDSGYVQTTYGAVQVFQALIGLPLISSLLTDRRPWPFRMETGYQRDLSLARWSMFLLIPGTLILGIAPNLATFIIGLILMGIGSGYSSFIRALASLYVDPEQRSRLFSLIGMVELAGSIYSGPMLAGFFSLGMKLGDNWISLPYFVLASMIGLASVTLLFVVLPKTEEDEPPLTHPRRAGEDGRESWVD